MSEISALKNFGDVILEKNPRAFIFDEIPSDSIIVVLDFYPSLEYRIYTTSPESSREYGYNKDEADHPKKYLSFVQNKVNISKFKRLLSELEDMTRVQESKEIIKIIISTIEKLEKELRIEKISEEEIMRKLNERINKEITEKIKRIRKKSQGIYVVLYYNGKPLVEYDGVLEAYRELYKKRFNSDPKTSCMVCGRKGAIIPKNPTDIRKVFPFYEILTFDKAHALSYFDKSTAYAYYPICFDCAVSALIGRKVFIDPYLRDVLGNNITWIVIPEVMSFDESSDEESLKRLYQDIVDWVSRIPKLLKEDEKYKKYERYKGLERVLRLLIEGISRENLDLLFHFIFISKGGGEGPKPLVYVNNVHEIVLRRIYKTFESIINAVSEAASNLPEDRRKKYERVQERLAENPLKQLYMFFNVSESAYSEVKESSAYGGLLAVEKLLRESPMPFEYYRAKAKLNINLALRRAIWFSDSTGGILELESLIKLIVFTEFLRRFGCLKYEDCIIESNMFRLLEEGKVMLGENLTEVYENLAKRLLENLDPAAKSAYSLGVLLGLLAVAQSKKLSKDIKDVPIVKRITSLHLSEIRLKSLFSEIQSKADYYDARSPLFKVFEKTFNESWMEIARKRPNWLDMEYYFALGLSSVFSGYLFDVFRYKEERGEGE